MKLNGHHYNNHRNSILNSSQHKVILWQKCVCVLSVLAHCTFQARKAVFSFICKTSNLKILNGSAPSVENVKITKMSFSLVYCRNKSNSHHKALSSAISSKSKLIWHFMCLFKLADCVKAASQILQIWFRCPEWIPKWIFLALDWLNVFWQMLHSYGFSPVWIWKSIPNRQYNMRINQKKFQWKINKKLTRMWAVKSPDNANDLSQNWHLKGFMPLCIPKSECNNQN